MHRKCERCGNWAPHIKYYYLGFCAKREDISLRDFSCEFYTEIKLEGEFFWCEDCKSLISFLELESHMEMGHRIFRGVFLDSDYREEIYEG